MFNFQVCFAKLKVTRILHPEVLKVYFPNKLSFSSLFSDVKCSRKILLMVISMSYQEAQCYGLDNGF